jgi:hypothetical protein
LRQRGVARKGERCRKVSGAAQIRPQNAVGVSPWSEVALC